MVKASFQDANYIRSVLDMFFSHSSLNMNVEKLRIYFSRNTNQRFKENISNILGIQATDNKGAYLGFPLHSNFTNRSFNHILDKLKARLSNWKSKFLNLARRKVLIKSALENIPPHYFQCTLIPKSIYNKIDAISKDFLWGSPDENRKMHVVG